MKNQVNDRKWLMHNLVVLMTDISELFPTGSDSKEEVELINEMIVKLKDLRSMNPSTH